MRLTQKQEMLITQYVRAVGLALERRLSQTQVERALSRLNERIQSHLKTDGSALARDEEVKAVLDTLGEPEQQATILARIWGKPEEGISPLSRAEFDVSESIPPAQREKAGSGGTGAAAGSPAKASGAAASKPAVAQQITAAPAVSPLWLGVLGYCANQWGIPAWALRALVFILGCITAPAALVLYVMAYLALRLSGRVATGRLRPLVMLWRPFSLVAVTGAIYAGGVYGLRGIRFAHETYLRRPMPDLREWAWLETESVLMLTVTLALFLPVALLSAMPLPATWDRSLKRLSQAGVALYAVAVSFGIASFITGLILAFVQEFTR